MYEWYCSRGFYIFVCANRNRNAFIHCCCLLKNRHLFNVTYAVRVSLPIIWAVCFSHFGFYTPCLGTKGRKIIASLTVANFHQFTIVIPFSFYQCVFIISKHYFFLHRRCFFFFFPFCFTSHTPWKRYLATHIKFIRMQCECRMEIKNERLSTFFFFTKREAKTRWIEVKRRQGPSQILSA